VCQWNETPRFIFIPPPPTESGILTIYVASHASVDILKQSAWERSFWCGGGAPFGESSGKTLLRQSDCFSVWQKLGTLLCARTAWIQMFCHISHFTVKLYSSPYIHVLTYFYDGLTALVDLGLLHEVPRSHSDTPHSVGLLWTRDRPVAETATLLHTTLNKKQSSMLHGGIRNRNPSQRAAVDRRLRPRGHRDRRAYIYCSKILIYPHHQTCSACPIRRLPAPSDAPSTLPCLLV
jgi:hypothetical protein